ncbi:hypothetical protein BS78_01G388000 [Paspalum vaginatum]|nr:hypothetical protein BS78_01G388000 [Paspalum vaginatum]
MPSRLKPPPPERASGNWSDGETSTLIDTWGPLHLRRRPGCLLLKDWRAAASAVNAHRFALGRRLNRSRAQCKTRIRTLKRRYKEEAPKQPPSGWRYLHRLHAFLASPDGPPPGFPAKQEEGAAGGGSGFAGSSAVPRRPRNAAAAGAGFCPAALVSINKLAEVYERVELARIDAEKHKTEVEAQQAMWEWDAVKLEQ